MAVEYKIWNFPTFPISGQLFHVPGAAVEGGFTSGGARITSPEPGGRSVLEIKPSLRDEFEYPLASWIMSKINGQIFRVRLAPTPQILSARSAPVPWDGDILWSNQQMWQGDFISTFVASALEGTNVVRIDMSGLGPRLRHGHVIGHDHDSYIVDDIEYQGTVAIVTVNPPLRRNIDVGDTVLFRPYFTGSISNGAEIRKLYEKELNGHLSLEKIVFDEVVVP